MKRPPEALVRLREVDAGWVIALRYATNDNLTGRVLYASAEAWLRRETAWKLRTGAEMLVGRGLKLKVLDAYRPPSAQRALWAACPDPRFVASPDLGSRHTRGAAVDVTLVDGQGRELEMPSVHDAFGESARRDAPGASRMARLHAGWLHAAMTGAGFVGIASEWWHFDDADWRRYPLLEWEPGG
ncbi:MAG: M15 family metallopeptidase [Verrucomicrobiae bacterium]|nr:M15 family metallopeptidase [Verrucomicrobiae bacterium]